VTGEIVREVVYPHPVDLVWRALTEPAALAGWLMENDFRPEVGHLFTFRTTARAGFDGTVRCEVLEVDPPRHLTYTWQGGGGWMKEPTTVTWRLEPVAGGTRVRLEHRGFAGVRGSVLRGMILGPGWGRLVGTKLRRYLDEMALQTPTTEEGSR
jgi:uncharacterized protein YndB with AHSA1/START domain